MKKIFYIVIILIIILGFEIIHLKQKKTIKPKNPTPTIVQEKKAKPIKKDIFIPSWNVKDDEDYSQYSRLLYFGISATGRGINKNDEGYKNMDEFIKNNNSQAKKYLVLKMLNQDENQIVLNDEKKQQTIINEIFELINEKKFQGLALDLEISGLLSNDTARQINIFVQKIYTSTKNYYIPFSVILYGDTFYRKRPYDVDTISRNCDEVMVMAYDFHKTIGEPGPNFPLSKGRSYQYDFKTMINDYLIFVPPEKLTVIFGMYGYEWIVDEKKRPIKPAKALTLKEIKKSFIEKCEWQDCVVKRDSNSFEVEVNFIQSAIINTYAAMNMHVIWFEDEESVRMKTEYLKEKGIYSIGYWVAGYF